MNAIKTFLLFAALSALMVAVGGVLGGEGGAALGFLLSLATNGFSYWFSDKIVLASHGARVVDEAQAPRLVATVRELAQRAELPMPKVALIADPAPNAFATGRGPRSAVIAVTEGLLRMTDERELRGVLAHELGHIRNRDILLATLAASMVGSVTLLARWGFWFGGSRDRNVHPAVQLLVLLLAPLAAVLVQLAISRSREFSADAAGAAISGDPLALASALDKLERHADGRRVDPAASHLYIVNPLRGGLASLFRTHPPTAARIERLERMHGGG